jgi:hypothetical protein
VSRLKNFITRADEKPIRRLAIQFSDGFIEQLLQRFGTTDETATAWQWLEALLKDLEETTGQTGRSYSESTFQARQKLLRPSVVRTEYWVAWVSKAVGKSETPTLYKLFSDRPEELEIIYSAIKRKHEQPPGKIPVLWREEIGAIIKEPQNKNNEEPISTDSKELQDTQLSFPEEIKPSLNDKNLQQKLTVEGAEKSKDVLPKLLV